MSDWTANLPNPDYRSDDGSLVLYRGDCMEVMPKLPENIAQLIATDPPYFKVKSEAWDRQWDKAYQFIDWIGHLCEHWHRLMAPNGSIYCFASPKMRSRVELKIAERFNCLPTITWVKHDGSGAGTGAHSNACKESLRAYFPQTEAIIFAEHYGSDNIAKGEAGYAAKLDELRGFLFEPLRAYLDGERDRAGLSTRQVAEAFQRKTGSRTVTGMAGHWFGRVQWTLPTEANYKWLRKLFSGDYLRREYDYLRREYDDLRREYDDLRREYDYLRRPFSVSADVPYTDVWNFPTVMAYKGKHPCEKPLSIMEHIVSASSRPGDVVVDPFMGSGTTGLAAKNLGRKFIGVELDPGYFKIAVKRIDDAFADQGLFTGNIRGETQGTLLEDQP